MNPADATARAAIAYADCQEDSVDPNLATYIEGIAWEVASEILGAAEGRDRLILAELQGIRKALEELAAK
jgi:hypothetical protein